MRCDQFVGLNEWARILVAGCRKPHFSGKYEEVEVVHPDGRSDVIEVPVLEPCVFREENGFYEGMFEDKYPLYKYTFRCGQHSGKVFYERVQADPWSSGPVVFLALQDENGNWIKESLWDEEDIANA